MVIIKKGGITSRPDSSKRYIFTLYLSCWNALHVKDKTLWLHVRKLISLVKCISYQTVYVANITYPAVVVFSV